MELDTKSISILNKPPKTVIFRCLLTINHERQKPLFCPKTLARQALELQVFRPESLPSAPFWRHGNCLCSVVVFALLWSC